LPPITRRAFLEGSALAALAALLAACDGRASPSTRSSAGATASASAAGSPSGDLGTLAPTGPLTFANWRGSIDLARDRVTSPTIAEFEKQYNVEVDYAGSEIEDNESFVGLMRPQLEAGVEPGWDLVVVADWMAARMVDAGWAESIDPAHVPNAVEHIRPEVKGPPWDASNGFHYPWLSVATGVAWNRAAIGRDLASVGELFDPALAGKVTLLGDPRATLPLIHLLLGASGATSDRPVEEMTIEDVDVAIDYLRPFVESGHVRAFTRSEYVGDLADRTTSAAMALSPDVAPIVGTDIGWAYPAEGWLLGSNDLVIPRAAKNRLTAELMIDWVYDPVRAARIAMAASSITPVRGAEDATGSLEDAPAPTSPAYRLLFPPADVADRRHRYPLWDEETSRQVEDRFGELTGA
jgi:spermidine/putrescine transport system substrate-binding protein